MAMLILSCNDSISPYAPFQEDYILNGIIRGDTSYQVITLSHSYQPKGPEPASYKSDPAITGAAVEIYYDNKVYVLRDSSIARTDTSHFNSSFKFYYTKDLKPDANKIIRVKAVLPNGKVISSSARTPNVQTPGFFDRFNDYYFPSDSIKGTTIRWDNIGQYAYAPRLYINYLIKGDSTLHKFPVPLSYQPDSTPVYYNPTQNNYLNIPVSIITKTLDELGSTTSDRFNIKIVSLTIDVLTFDQYLTTYYSSIELGINGFTIRVDVPDYSNVNGGLGIFGAYMRTRQSLSFKSGFISHLGFYQ